MIINRLNKFILNYMSFTRGKKPKALRLSKEHYYEYYRYLTEIGRLNPEYPVYSIPIEVGNLWFIGVPLIRSDNDYTLSM